MIFVLLISLFCQSADAMLARSALCPSSLFPNIGMRCFGNVVEKDMKLITDKQIVSKKMIDIPTCSTNHKNKVHLAKNNKITGKDYFFKCKESESDVVKKYLRAGIALTSIAYGLYLHDGLIKKFIDFDNGIKDHVGYAVIALSGVGASLKAYCTLKENNLLATMEN